MRINWRLLSLDLWRNLIKINEFRKNNPKKSENHKNFSKDIMISYLTIKLINLTRNMVKNAEI